MVVVGPAAVFQHPLRPYLGHESDGIGAWNVLVEKYEGNATQLCYMLDKKLKDMEIKADDDPDIFWPRLLNINALMDKVGEGFTERELIDIVIDKLMPAYRIILVYIRNPINFSTTAQIQNPMRLKWIPVIQPKVSKKDSTARVSGMPASSSKSS